MKSTVMVFGTFDIPHLGHIYLFRKAKKYGNKLVVVVARDINVKKTIFHNETQRLLMLEHIDLVDKAVLGHKTNFYQPIKKIRPDVIVLGYDQKPNKQKLGVALKKLGFSWIRVVRLPIYGREKCRSRKMREYIRKNI